MQWVVLSLPRGQSHEWQHGVFTPMNSRSTDMAVANGNFSLDPRLCFHVENGRTCSLNASHCARVSEGWAIMA
jgi:hypothetical protein